MWRFKGQIFMKELLKQAESIINKRFDKNDPNYGLLVMGCFALLSKFGEDYTPIVERVMLETEFYIGKKPLSELLKEGGIDAEDAFRGEEFYDTEMTVTAISSPGVYLSIGENGKIVFERETPAIFCITIGEDANAILNAFVHEVGCFKPSVKIDLIDTQPLNAVELIVSIDAGRVTYVTYTNPLKR